MEVSGKVAEASKDLTFCENCQFDNVTTKAVGKCRDCSENMCYTCFRNHLTGRRNRNHKLTTLNDQDIAPRTSTEEVEKCKQHDNEAIRFYCRKHEMVGCGDCIILEHTACKPEYINVLSINIQETEHFNELKRKITKLELENKANGESIRKNREDCKTMDMMEKEALADIRKFRSDIKKYLDDAESAIKSEMKHLRSNTEKRLDKLDNDYAKCSSDIKTLKQTLDTTVQRDNVLFIQTVRSKASILEIEHELSTITHSVGEVTCYEFVPNQQLASIIKSRGKFGKLNIHHKPEGSFAQPETSDARSPPVVVGSRVKGDVFFGEEWLPGQLGTVTDVKSDASVIVKWDATGESYFHRVGSRPRDVKLI